MINNNNKCQTIPKSAGFSPQHLESNLRTFPNIAKPIPKRPDEIIGLGQSDISSEAPLIIRAFSDGAMIKSDKGVFLAIPTAAAPKRGIGGKRINPDNFPEHSLGRLRFVYRKGAPSLLVVDNLRAGTGKRGGYRKASESALKSGRGLATVVMFILLPQVMLKKRLDVDGAMQRWRDKLPQLILQNFTETNDAER